MRNASIGLLVLSREDCNNVDPQTYWRVPALKFGLLPYGDCSLVDGARFTVVPLGPSFEHGFPTNVHTTAVPTVRARRHLLNLMASWTVEKPTRVQATMAALAVCDAHAQTSASSSTAMRGSGRDCVVEHNDLAFKALQRIDAAAGTNLRWLLSSAPSAYIKTLKQSVFTLYPHGKHLELYRTHELDDLQQCCARQWSVQLDRSPCPSERHGQVAVALSTKRAVSRERDESEVNDMLGETV